MHFRRQSFDVTWIGRNEQQDTKRHAEPPGDALQARQGGVSLARLKDRQVRRQ